MPAQLSAEEQAKLAGIRAELETVAKAQVEAGLKTAEAANLALTQKMEAMAADLLALKSKAGVEVPGLDKQEAQKFSFARAALAMAKKDWSRASFENEVLTEAYKNAQQTRGTNSEGGYLVPTIVAQDVIERLKARAVLMQVGTTELNLSGIGKFDLPRVSSSSTALWLGELDEITESAMAFDKVTLDPKKVAGLVRMSRELLADANQSVENIVRNDLASQLALSIDLKGLMGDGLNDTPTGILNTVGISTYTDTNGTPANFATFDELIGKLEDENALRGNLAFISNPRVFRALRNQTVLQFSGQGAGQPIYTPLISDAQLESYLGYKIGKTTQIPKNGTKGNGTNLSKLFFGNFDDLIYATWGGLEIDASDVAGDNFVKYSVQLRAVMRCDFVVRQPKSFAVATDIGTVAVHA